MIPVCRVHIGHRITSKRHKDSAEPIRRTTTEVQQEAAAPAPNLTWNSGQGVSDLQCPRCQATFSDREAAEYLIHWEECAKL